MDITITNVKKDNYVAITSYFKSLNCMSITTKFAKLHCEFNGSEKLQFSLLKVIVANFNDVEIYNKRGLVFSVKGKDVSE